MKSGLQANLEVTPSWAFREDFSPFQRETRPRGTRQTAVPEASVRPHGFHLLTLIKGCSLLGPLTKCYAKRRAGS